MIDEHEATITMMKKLQQHDKKYLEEICTFEGHQCFPYCTRFNAGKSSWMDRSSVNATYRSTPLLFPVHIETGSLASLVTTVQVERE